MVGGGKGMALAVLEWHRASCSVPLDRDGLRIAVQCMYSSAFLFPDANSVVS